MFIKSITIDGFKSYAERTVVNEFDRSFNSITGLNGSGKYQWQPFDKTLYRLSNRLTPNSPNQANPTYSIQYALCLAFPT